MIEFPGLVQRNAIENHLKIIRQIMQPNKAVKGLTRINKMLNRYAETFMFPPTQKKVFVRIFLRLFIRSYRQDRRVKMCLVLQRVRDRPDRFKKVDRSSKIQAGILIGAPPAISTVNQRSKLLGRYSDRPLQKLLKELKVRTVLKLSTLIRRKVTNAKLCSVLQRFADRNTPPKSGLTEIVQSINRVVLPHTIRRQVNEVILGRGRDTPLDDRRDKKIKMAYLKSLLTAMSHTTQNKVLALMEKSLDKLVPQKSLHMELKAALESPFQHKQKATGGSTLIFGRNGEYTLPTPVLKALGRLQGEFWKLFVGTNRADIGGIFQKYQDKESKFHKMTNELSISNDGQRQKSPQENLTSGLGLGKYQDTPQRPMNKAMQGRTQGNLVVDKVVAANFKTDATIAKLYDKEPKIKGMSSQVAATNEAMREKNPKEQLMSYLGLGKYRDTPQKLRHNKFWTSNNLDAATNPIAASKGKSCLVMTRLRDRWSKLQGVMNTVAISIDSIRQKRLKQKLIALLGLGKYGDLPTPLAPSKFKGKSGTSLVVHPVAVSSGNAKLALSKTADKRPIIAPTSHQFMASMDHTSSTNLTPYFKTSLILGKRSDYPLTKFTDKFKTSSVFSAWMALQKVLKEQFKLTLQKTKDRPLTPTKIAISIVKAFETANPQVVHQVLSHSMIFGKRKDLEVPNPSNTFSFQSLWKPDTPLFKLLTQKIQLQMNRFRDRKFSLSLIRLIAKHAIGFKVAPGFQRASKTMLILGRAADATPEKFPSRSGSKHFLIVSPDLRKKIVGKINLLLAKYADKKKPVLKVSHMIKGYITRLQNSQRQKRSQNLIVLGRFSAPNLSRMNESYKLKAFLRSIMPVQASQGRANLFLQRLKDNKLGLASPLVKAQAALMTNNVPALSHAQHSSYLMERIADKEMLNPQYSLAIVGCFERFYGDLHFNSWTDLHSAMRAYLEAVRDLDSANTSFEFIRQALLHLRPFYKRGNLNYQRFFNNFRGSVKLAVQSQYQGETISQALGRQVLDCEKALKIFTQLDRLCGQVFAGVVGEKARKLFVELKKLASECKNGFSVAEILTGFERRARIDSEIEAQLRNLSDFLSISLSDLVQLKELVNKSGKIFTSNLAHLAMFFEQNHGLATRIYGQARIDAVHFMFKVLKESKLDVQISLRDLLGPTEEEIETKLQTAFESDAESLEKLRLAIAIIRGLFLKVRNTALELIPFTHYTFSGEIEQKMGFCSRYSSKISILTSKVREKITWQKTQVKMVGLAMESIAKEGAFNAKKFNGLTVRTYDNLLRPFLIKTMMAAYVRNFGDMKFRDYNHHFKTLFSRFVGTFIRSKILSRAEGKAVTQILGDKQFFKDHSYRFSDVLVRYVSADINFNHMKRKEAGKAVTDYTKHLKNKSKSRQSAFLGKIKALGLYKALDMSKLKKNLLTLMSGQKARNKVSDLVARLQRIRVKFFDKSVQDFAFARRFIGPTFVYDRSKRARIFYRTFHKIIGQDSLKHLSFRSDIVRLVRNAFTQKAGTGGIRRSIFKGLTKEMTNAMKFYQNHQAAFFSKGRRSDLSFKKSMHKYLATNLMNKLCHSAVAEAGYKSLRTSSAKSMRRRQFKHFLSKNEVRQELMALQQAGRRAEYKKSRGSLRKQRFKNAIGEGLKKYNFRAQNVVKGALKRSLPNSFRRKRFKQMLDGIQKSLGLKSRANKASTISSMVKQLSFRRKQMKYLEAKNSIRLQFLKDVLAPRIAEKVVNSATSKRYFLKVVDQSDAIRLKYQEYLKDKMENSIFLSTFAGSKRWRNKWEGLLTAEQAFLKFIEQKYRAFTASDLHRIQLMESKRNRIKEVENLVSKAQAGFRLGKGAGAFSGIRQALRDFKRVYSTLAKPGKYTKNVEGRAEFKLLVKRLISKNTKKPEFGSIKLPDTNTPGKYTGTSKQNIFCCGCACSTCVTDELCTSGPGLEECLEHQKRVNSDASFIVRAASMVNIDPIINFFLNVKDNDGTYKELAVMRFGERSANKEFLEETLGSRAELNQRI
jgi:hypothetical protein